MGHNFSKDENLNAENYRKMLIKYAISPLSLYGNTPYFTEVVLLRFINIVLQYI